MNFLEVRLNSSLDHVEALRALYTGSLGMDAKTPPRHRRPRRTRTETQVALGPIVSWQPA